MRKYIILYIVLCLHGLARGQTSNMTVFYWFDNHQGKPTVLPTVQGSFEIDASSLSDGVHAFHYAVVMEDGGMSSPFTSYFLKIPSEDVSLKGFYRFDNESMVYESPNLKGAFNVDVSSLSDGFHQFSFFATQSDGGQSNLQTCYFLKIAQVLEDDSLTCLCSVDGQLRHVEKLPQQGGFIYWNLDMQDLTDGVHHIQLQAMTKSGALSKSYSTYFMRVTSTEELSEMRCIYSIDNDSFETKSEIVGHNGKFHFDLDLPELDEGLHYITFLLNNDRGTSTTAQTRFFVKAPIGGNGIDRYQYWLNEDSIEQATTITLPQKVNPFRLISLLPVESRPLRSSQFHFEAKDGKPMMYAKNEFHARFFDAADRFTDASDQYIDYNVGQEVIPVGELQATQTFDKVAENNVRWYTIECARGDSLQFKLDRAATIQLFSSTGEELYCASGFEAVKWGGCHVKENGTYYFALHDVTAQQGTTICIDFDQISKYAILAYTPERFSAMGTTMMHFTGNGLTFVKSIELINGDDVICPDTIVASISELLACFSLNADSNIEKTYSLKVVFHDEVENDSRTISKQDAITIEPANKGDIAIRIETERRVGDPYPIKVTMKNTGNVGYYDIPVDIAFDHPDLIDEFRFMNFMLMLSDSIYNSREFFTYTDNLVGTGQYGFFMPILVPYLAPYEERTFVFGVRTKIAHAKFNFYAWAGDPWDDGIHEENESNVSNVRRNAPPCNPSNIPDAYNVAGHGGNPGRVVRPWLGVGEAISGIVQGLSRASADATYDAYNVPANEREYMQFQNCVRSPYDIARDAHPFQIRRKASGGGSAIDTNASSDCPNPDPHHTDVYIPGDPNEMHGIVSEAGSRYIRQDVMGISYTIEFENDPELANASAHKIVVRDTLNTKVFDTSTFKPASVKIGDKSIDLDGDQSFVKTIDMRPEINAIAQVQLDFSQQTGIAVWTITSLDPMTMEETYDIMQGVLPVNYEGNGVGYMNFDVNLKKPLDDGKSFSNRAGIVFDYEEAILTPTWTNIVDAVAPTSIVDGLTLLNDSTVRVFADASDARSGVWKYEWYVQHGENAPWWKEGETFDDCFDFHFYEGIDYGFCVLATDSAGNVEQKVIQRERSFKTYGEEFDEAVGLSPLPASPDGEEKAIYDLSGRRQAVPKENQVNIIDKKKVLIR